MRQILSSITRPIVSNYLTTDSRLKRLAEKAGLEAETTASLSGHSMRVGAAQDMAEEGFDLLALMTAGGWKTAHVVARYVEEARVRRVGERRHR